MSAIIVIYESMFGNTEQVARAIADGLGDEARLFEVGVAPTSLPDGIELLVIGGPTHAFGMTRPATREDAAQQATGPLVSRGIGIREWIEAAAPSLGGLRFAAFDTHVEHPRTLRHVGSAARSITRALEHAGLQEAARAEHFWVTGTLGPLTDGELERAREWGASLAKQAVLR